MTRLEELQAKLAKSRNKAGYAERVKAIEEEIARLKAEEQP